MHRYQLQKHSSLTILLRMVLSTKKKNAKHLHEKQKKTSVLLFSRRKKKDLKPYENERTMLEHGHFIWDIVWLRSTKSLVRLSTLERLTVERTVTGSTLGEVFETFSESLV